MDKQISQTAVNYKIPLIMYGENGEVEYGGDMKNAYKPTRDYNRCKKHYFSGLGPEDLVKYGVSMEDIKPYIHQQLDELGCEIHFYGYYKKWVPQNFIIIALIIQVFLLIPLK